MIVVCITPSILINLHGKREKVKAEHYTLSYYTAHSLLIRTVRALVSEQGQHSIQNHLVKSIIKSFCYMELNHNRRNILHFWKAWRWLIQPDVELGTETEVQQGTLLPASLNRNQTRTPAQKRLHHMTLLQNNNHVQNKLFIPRSCTDYVFLTDFGMVWIRLWIWLDLFAATCVCVSCSQFVFSRTIAIPWPPPMQAEPTAYFPPRLLGTENTTHHMTSCYINTAMHDRDYTTWKWHLNPFYCYNVTNSEWNRIFRSKLKTAVFDFAYKL